MARPALRQATRSARRALRRHGGRLIRQWGLLPEGDPDGLGDDDQLAGTAMPFTIMVYFADTPRNLYQLRQWYEPLRRLATRHRVGVVCLDSRTTAAVRAESGLPVISVARVATLEDMVSRSDIALALYVNHNVRNFHPLRFPSMLHCYLGHGESDKESSASNQVKAYDAVLVAGEARRDQLRRNLMCFDADAHVRLVGRPQLDGPMATTRGGQPTSDGRPTVLYAPTWEGAQPSMAYSSVITHGQPLLQALLASREFHVVYRPHPRTGANQAAYAEADQQLRSLIATYQQADPQGRHRVDLADRWEAREDSADLLVSDISAVANDWLATDRPLIVTVPAALSATLAGDSILQAVTGLAASDAPAIVGLVRDELAASASDTRRQWVERTMGDTTPGASIARFLDTCDALIALRSRELADRAARLAGDQR